MGGPGFCVDNSSTNKTGSSREGTLPVPAEGRGGGAGEKGHERQGSDYMGDNDGSC